MLLAARGARTLDDIDTQRLEWIFGLFPAMKKFWLHPAGKLSGGQKQMLAVSRAIVEPRKLLLIDEPSKGLAPAIIQNMIAAFRELKAAKTTILLVEQNFNFARQLGDTVAVMTDAALVLCTTLAMFAFWFSLDARDAAERRWMGWLFFVAQGLGLLAKGPVAVVLSGLPILLWIVVEKRWQQAWRGLPWLRGSLLALAIAAPWYVLAELRTPGFLNYFLVGEHWHRFVTPGWTGDLYGHAHEFARGTIWGFAWGALLPWSVLLPLAAWHWRRTPAAPETQPSLRLYLLLSLLTPLVFFTAARNIIWTYALPSLPAAALLMAHWLARRSVRAEAWVAAGLLVSLAGAGIGFGRLAQEKRQEERSAKGLVNAYAAESSGDQPLMYVERRPFSAAFYSRGRALQLKQLKDAVPHLGPTGGYLVVEQGQDPSALAAAGLQMQARVGRYGNDELLRVTLPDRQVAATERAAPR